MSPITMEVDLNKTDRMAVDLWRGKIMDMDNKIQLYQDYRKHLHTQIANIVGKQLLNQYLQNCKPEIGQIIVDYVFGYLYMFDGSDTLKLITGKEYAND
jgi:uncharacterized protein YbcI